MRFRLDENLGRAVTTALQSAGHDTQTVLEQGIAGATAHKVIHVCQSEQRCLVALHLHFANPLLFDPAEYAGIAVIRVPSRLSHQNLRDACKTLIAGLETGDIAGRLWII